MHVYCKSVTHRSGVPISSTPFVNAWSQQVWNAETGLPMPTKY